MPKITDKQIADKVRHYLDKALFELCDFEIYDTTAGKDAREYVIAALDLLDEL